MNYNELGNWFLHSLAALCHREESASHQEVNFHRNLKILTKSWSCSTSCGMVQDLRWIQVEYTLAILGQCREFIIWIRVDNTKLREQGSLP